MTYFIDPFGCVKNQVDAENMMAFLDDSGWNASEDAETADLIIINSCGFIESAKQESINAVLGWRRLYPEKKILLAGCLAQRYAKDLSSALPEADGLFGTDDISAIARAAENIMRPASYSPHGVEAPVGTQGTSASRGGRPGKRPLLSLPGSAYVKISEGCNNRCSFCAIPLIRGGLKSRKIPDIVKECKALLSRGIKELCLISQDSGSYGRDLAAGRSSNRSTNIEETPSGLPNLLEAISRLEGKFRVRLLYIHPDHFPLPILDIMEKDERFLRYFDIPFQHGSEKIIKTMNRRGAPGVYLDLIKTIRARLPDAVIRSTFMTGFPGETEEDFELLLDFQQKAAMDWVGCFTYSREEDTPAWGMKGRVTKKTAAERKRLVEEHQIRITEKQMDRFVGRVFDVLVEEEFDPLMVKVPSNGKAENNNSGGILYLGRLPCQAPEVDGAAVILSDHPLEKGALIPCRVYGRAGFDLQARPL